MYIRTVKGFVSYTYLNVQRLRIHPESRRTSVHGHGHNRRATTPQGPNDICKEREKKGSAIQETTRESET